jgi:hypothetical protein
MLLEIPQKGYWIPDLGPEIESRLVAFFKKKFGDCLTEVLLTLGECWGEYWLGINLSSWPADFKEERWELTLQCRQLVTDEEMEHKPHYFIWFHEDGSPKIHFPKGEQTKILFSK